MGGAGRESLGVLAVVAAYTGAVGAAYFPTSRSLVKGIGDG